MYDAVLWPLAMTTNTSQLNMTTACTEMLEVQYYISKIWINCLSMYKHWNLRNTIKIYQYKTHFLSPYTQIHTCKIWWGVQMWRCNTTMAHTLWKSTLIHNYSSRKWQLHRMLATDCKAVACWTTHCVKGFLSFNPLAFTEVPTDMTISKLCEDLMFGNCVWRCVYKIICLVWWQN